MTFTPPIGLPISGQDRGYGLADEIRPMTVPANNAALVVGSLVEVDKTVVDSTTGAWTTIKDVAAADIYSGIFCVAQEAVPNNASATQVARFLFTGKTKLLVAGNAATVGLDIAANDAPANSGDILTNVAVGAKVIGVNITTGSNAVVDAWFNGVTGFGNDV